MYRVTAKAYQTSYMELLFTFVLPSYYWIVANLMFKNPIAEAMQISETKKTEFNRIKCEKAIV